MILEKLPLRSLWMCRMVNKQMAEFCRRQLFTQYINKSYAFMGVYTCGWRIRKGRWYSEKWRPYLDPEATTITWKGKVFPSSLPIDGLFIWVSVPKIKTRLAFADLPRACPRCRVSEDFKVATYVQSDDVMEDLEIDELCCNVQGHRIAKTGVNGEAFEEIREVLEWRQPEYCLQRPPKGCGAYCRLNYLNHDDTWEFGMSLWSFMSILLSWETECSPKWFV